MHYFDASTIDLSELIHAFSFLSTVDNNKKYFGQREIRKVDAAVMLNRRVNHMAKGKYVRVVKSDLIRNNPLTVGDVRRSHVIYGPPLPPIKGRTRYQESPRVKDVEIVQIPTTMFENLKHVTLCLDFHYVNGVPVFHTISGKIGYRTVSFPLSRTKTSIMDEIFKVYKMYNSRGFRIVDIHVTNLKR